MTSRPVDSRGRVPRMDGTKASKIRWLIAIACAIGLAINYIDRSAISVSLPFMTQDFHLTPTEQGLILSAFSWSYALMQIPAGRLIDRFGERLMFGASVLVWSVFTGLTAIASSFGVLLGLRLGLGIGEAGAYPSSAKTVARWFNPRQRGRATAVYDSGARIGSAVATPLIVAIIAIWGWRSVFVLAFVIGVLWTAGWWALYRHPEALRSVNQAELDFINEGRAEAPATQERPMALGKLLRFRTVWAMMLGFFCVNFMVTFFLTWFPSYLVNERGFDLLGLGVFGAIPPIAAIAGSWIGGLVGDALLARGWTLTRVRKTCLVSGMLICSVIALAAVAPESWQVLTLMSISYAAASFTIVTIWCLPADVAPTGTVASLGASQNFFSNIGSALSPIVIGALYGATGSFVFPLVLSGAVAVAGALIFGLMLRRVEPLVPAVERLAV
ncbi:MFS transporter [Microbacterium sp.]|uniref:MFS transporter n=1 Tax=Microbacterium sp. TaxID=51671 RepID=UPI0039E59B1F